MAALPLLPPNSSQVSISDKVSTLTTNFTRVPYSISLNRSSSSVENHQNQRGFVENLHLVSLSKQGQLKEAYEFLQEMDRASISVNSRSYEGLFGTCRLLGSLSYGRLIHNQLRRAVTHPSEFLENCLLRMYLGCGSFSDAQKLFDGMCTKSSASWAIIISSYAHKGLFAKAFDLFSEMQVAGNRPNSSICLSLLKAVMDPSYLEFGRQIHSYVIRTGLILDAVVGTVLFNMYMACDCFESAELAFDQMTEKNVVTWTRLISYYTKAEKREEALVLFARMINEGVQLDEFVFSTVLQACSGLNDSNVGRQIHGYIVKHGMDKYVSTGAPLVDFYVKCGNLENACHAFWRIYDQNDVSWSAIIAGYTQTGKFQESVEIFKSLRSRAIFLNSHMYTSIFHACTEIADFNLGTQVHGDAIKRHLVSELYGESALVTMYSRSGRLDDARQAFESIVHPDTVAWTAMIVGCSCHGNASEALRLFKRMQSCGIRPNAVTLVGVLTACSHGGLVSEARQYLNSMSSEYGVDPSIDHYDCMVDIYSRAGHLEEAFKLIMTMPFVPDAMSWKSLLGGCCTHRNLKLGRIAAGNLLQLNSEDTAAYVLMFNLYTLYGKWEEAAHVRKVMAERGLRKEVSCSWINVKGKVHRFIVGDRHHPQTEEIYSKLDKLNGLINNDKNIVSVADEIFNTLPERKEQLLTHSERLAIAFGLISLPSNAPILVFKNLRACHDCHDFAKQVSEVTGREIVVRDSNRFHHFKYGQCSCSDYW